MWIPGVLSWAPGQPCNSHHSRHTGQDTVVVPCLRCGSFLNHKSVGGRGCGQQPGAFFPYVISLCVLRVSPLLVFPSEYRHCLCFFCWFSQSTTIACVSVFSAPGTARARSFSTHERSRTTDSTVSEHIDHKDRRQLQLFQRLALRRGRASFYNICQHTSSRPPIAGLFVTPWNKDDMGDGVPTDQLSHNHCDCTDSHCNSHSVTSCVFVLVLHSITSPSAADSFYFLELLGMG